MEKIYHPIFGLLTDEEDIRVYRRQLAEEEYTKAMEKAYEEEYQRMCEKEAEDYNEYEMEMHCNPEYEDNQISFEQWLKIKYKK